MSQKYIVESKDAFVRRVKEYKAKSVEAVLYKEAFGETEIPVLLTNEEKGTLYHSKLKYFKTRHLIRFEAKTPYEEHIQYIEVIPHRKVSFTGSEFLVDDAATLESEPYDEFGPEAVFRDMQEKYNQYIREMDCKKVRENMRALRSELKIPVNLVDFGGNVIIL